MIWLSDTFKLTFPQIEKNIEKNQDSFYITEDLFHTFCDLMQLDFSVLSQNKSLVNESFKENESRFILNSENQLIPYDELLE